MSTVFNPCFEHCYVRYGKQYSADCDTNCAYAKAYNALKCVLNMLENEREGLREEVTTNIKDTFGIEV